MKQNTATLLLLISFTFCFCLFAGRARAATDSASIVTQPQLPLSMLTGAATVASITVQNTEDTDWTYDRGCKLVSLNPQWDPQQMELGPTEVVQRFLALQQRRGLTL